MAEEVKTVNQVQNQKQQNQQKDFTNKSQKSEVKQEVKLEKADPKFNCSVPEQTIQQIPSLKVDKVDTNFDMEVKAEKSKEVKESKVEVKETKVEIKKEEKVSGEVIAVSKCDYIVKTKDGKGVLIIGKHNKKVGDIIV